MNQALNAHAACRGRGCWIHVGDCEDFHSDFGTTGLLTTEALTTGRRDSFMSSQSHLA